MINRAKCILPVLVFLLAVACQKEVTSNVEPSGTPIVFRVEVEEGTEGAIACDYLESVEGIVWFGPAHSYRLHYAAPTTGSNGTPVVAFEIVSEEKESFADFTESIATKRMAIEVQGKIYSAPLVMDRLPGSGVIDRVNGGFTQEEVQELVLILRKGSA